MKEYEVKTMVSARSPEGVARWVGNHIKGGLTYPVLSVLLVTDPDDRLKRESRFIWTINGFKYVDTKCMAEDGFDPAATALNHLNRLAEVHASNLFHTLWRKAMDSGEVNSSTLYDKAEWEQLRMTLHDLGVDMDASGTGDKGGENGTRTDQ